MAGSFSGRVALITGAASGIGRASVLAFAREGACVVAADIDGDGAEEAAELGRQFGGELVARRTDVTVADDVEALVTATVDAFGRLDCAHNNAGVTGPFASTADYSLVDWNRTIAVNLTAVFLCMKHEIPAMLACGGGSIVNTASGAGLVGFAGLPAYVASKHGVVGLTKSVGIELASQGIRVNAVCPGSVRTPMLEGFIGGDPKIERQLAAGQPIGRLGEPEEVAEAVIWLCSDGASFMVGHALAVDGGAVAQ